MRKKTTLMAVVLSFMMLLSFGIQKEVMGYVLNRNEIEVAIDPDDVIQDQMLNWVIRTAINKTPDRSYAKLTKEDLVKELPEIYYSEGDHYDLYEFNVFVKSIEGLQYATNTERILLPYNQISDIKPMANLTKLNKIILNCNDISDITPLKNLTNVTNLHLGDNELKNIEAIANLTKLERLNLELNNDISDISVVKNFPKLKYLNLGYNSIEDIDSLKDLTNLEDGLILGHNRIEDISSLADMTKLKELDISSNNISDISVLKNLRNLKILRLSNNSGINDIAPLTNLTQLDKNELWLTGTGIADKKDDLFKVIDVNKLINKFKANEITLKDKEYVEAARAAYDALSPELQKYILELRITAAEENIAKLEKGEQIKQYPELSEFDKQPLELANFKTLKIKLEDKKGQPLPNVKFNLQNLYGDTVKVLTSDENGIVKYTVSIWDRYMDYEIVLGDKDNYTSDIEKVTFKTDGTPKIAEINGQPATGIEKLKFVLTKNDQQQTTDLKTLEFKAVDKNGQPISEVKFNISSSYDNHKSVFKAISDENGIVKYTVPDWMIWLTFKVELADTDKYTSETNNITFKTDKIGESVYIKEVDGKAFTGKEDLNFVLTTTEEDVKPAVDKTKLESAVKEAESKDSSKYTEESYKQLANALTVAKAILIKADATQEEVDTNVTNVINAIGKLVEKNTTTEVVENKTLQFKVLNKNGQPISGVKFNISNNYNKNVVEAISDENGMVKYTVPDWMIWMTFKVELADNDKYTSETNNITFKTDKIGESVYIKEVNGQPFTGEEDIKFVLTTTEEDVKPAVDKTKLESAIKEAESKDSSKYTEESYKQLTNALTVAKAILTKADATQEEVNTSIKNIEEAMDKLVEKSTIPEVKPVSTVASDNKKTSNEKISALPKTGGVSEGMSILLGSLVTAIGAIMLLSKKRN